MLILDTLKNEYSFTPLERHLSKYLLENIQSVLEMSLADLAESTYVSKATIIRFYKKLGFDSYKDFCIELAREVSSLQFSGTPSDSAVRLEAGDTEESISLKVMSANLQALNTTSQKLNYADLHNCAVAISGYSKICMHGIGVSGKLAADCLETYLTVLGKDVYRADTVKLSEYNALPAVQNAMFILLVYDMRNPEAVRIMEILSNQSVPVILITGPFTNDMKHHPYRILQTDYVNDSHYLFSCGQIAAMSFLIHTLVSEVFCLDYEQNRKTAVKVIGG